MTRLSVLILPLLFLAICSGCTQKISVNSEDISTIATETSPQDFQVKEEDIKFYDSLNLDGIGTHDDSLYISLYRWCNSDAAVIVLQVKLGTGETMAEVIPSGGDAYLYFGHLFSPEKDAVVIQVGFPRSDYGASKLYIYDIYGAGEVDSFPSIVEKFNCAGNNDFAPTVDKDIIKDDIVTMGTEIVKIDDYPLQGIALEFDNNNEKWNNFKKIIYWKENGWFVY